MQTWLIAESANNSWYCSTTFVVLLLYITYNPTALNERLKIKESENKDISYISRKLLLMYASCYHWREKVSLSTQNKKLVLKNALALMPS